MEFVTRNIPAAYRRPGVYTEPSLVDRIRYLTAYSKTLNLLDAEQMDHFLSFGLAFLDPEALGNLTDRLVDGHYDEEELYG